jgi:hypothetical protein
MVLVLNYIFDLLSGRLAKNTCTEGLEIMIDAANCMQRWLCLVFLSSSDEYSITPSADT